MSEKNEKKNNSKNSIDEIKERLFVDFVIEGLITTDVDKYESVKKKISSAISEIMQENDITKLTINFSKLTELEAMLLARQGFDEQYH